MSILAVEFYFQTRGNARVGLFVYLLTNEEIKVSQSNRQENNTSGGNSADNFPISTDSVLIKVHSSPNVIKFTLGPSWMTAIIIIDICTIYLY